MNTVVLQTKGLRQKWGMDMLQFNHVIGHEQVIAHLQNAIRMDKVSHAYLQLTKKQLTQDTTTSQDLLNFTNKNLLVC